MGLHEIANPTACIRDAVKVSPRWCRTTLALHALSRPLISY